MGELRVRQTYSPYRHTPYTVEEALRLTMCKWPDEGGQLERIEGSIDAMRDALARFMAQHISTVEQLNAVAGYEMFQEVKP